MIDPPREPDVATAVVVEGVLSGGSLADPPVPWWSFTKTWIAATALLLADAGRFALDTPLDGRRYTLRQLLQHRAGVPEYAWLKPYHEAVARGDPPWPVSELLERMTAFQMRDPGVEFIYSNVGYLYVRQMIENTTGEVIGKAVERLVLAPLGIAEARFVTTREDLVGTRWGNARGYDPGWVYHGLMVGPPAAAALMLDRLLRGHLLRPETLAAMQEAIPVFAAPIVPQDEGTIAGRPFIVPSYGLGLMAEIAKPAFFGHSGAGPGSTAAVYHFPTQRPCVTAAAFAPIDNEAVVERRVVEIARDLQES